MQDSKKMNFSLRNISKKKQLSIRNNIFSPIKKDSTNLMVEGSNANSKKKANEFFVKSIIKKKYSVNMRNNRKHTVRIIKRSISFDKQELRYKKRTQSCNKVSYIRNKEIEKNLKKGGTCKNSLKKFSTQKTIYKNKKLNLHEYYDLATNVESKNEILDKPNKMTIQNKLNFIKFNSYKTSPKKNLFNSN